MEQYTRSEIIKELAFENQKETLGSLDSVEVFNLDRQDHEYDILDFPLDPNKPTIAIYDRGMVESADFLAQAAIRLRKRGEDVANFVIVTAGLYSEHFVEDVNGTRLYVSAGYTRLSNGDAVIFDQPNNPLPISMVENGNFRSSTFNQLVDSGIPSLFPHENIKYEDKWLAKQKLIAAGINTPKAKLVSIDEIKKPTFQFPEKFVIKPTKGLGGYDVYIFNNGYEEDKIVQAFERISNFYQEVLIEEYLESLPIRLSQKREESSFNVRSVVYNGYCGGFARIYDKDKPGNVCSSAETLSLAKLRRIIERQHKIDPEYFDYQIENISNEVSKIFPNTFLGLDIMMDNNFNTHIIEINIGNFGAFDRNAISKKDWLKSLEQAVINISKVANKIQLPPEPNRDNSIARSILDIPENLILRFIEVVNEEKYYEGEEFKHNLFIEENIDLMTTAYNLFEERRLNGDAAYIVGMFDAFLETLEHDIENPLYKKIVSSLSKIAIRNTDSSD